MKETIKFKTPIKITGKTYKSLDYDPEELTCEQYIEATRLASQPGEIGMQEGDYAFHFYVGAELLIASNPEIDIRDFDQIKGYDIVKIVNIGRNFILSAEADSEDENSAEPSGSTAGSSTQAKQTSAKND